MVDVEYQPARKVIVHEAIKHELPEFLRMKARPQPNGAPPNPCHWCDGVIFQYSALPMTPELINQRVEHGVIHWNFIEFAELPDYQNIVNHPETQTQMGVINATNNSAIADVIRHFKGDSRFFPQTGV